MKVILKESKIAGKGLFAKADIKKGEKILTFKGELVNRVEIRKRIKEKKERLDDPLQVGEDWFLDLNDDSYYINHNCNPNAVLAGKADLIALKDIQKGEEITFDYSSTVGTNVEWWMKCSCKAHNCRKKIGNILSIPKKNA